MFDTLLYDCNRYGDTGISVNEHSNPYRYPFAVIFDILIENLHQPTSLLCNCSIYRKVNVAKRRRRMATIRLRFDVSFLISYRISCI